MGRCWPHEHYLRLISTYDIQWPKATGESPKFAVCVRWIDRFAPTPKHYRSHDDVAPKIQDASTKICMAALNVRSVVSVAKSEHSNNPTMGGAEKLF